VSRVKNKIYCSFCDKERRTAIIREVGGKPLVNAGGFVVSDRGRGSGLMTHGEDENGLKPSGLVSGLFRYPVKSMGGEELEACHVGESGLRGDRVRVLVKEDSEKQLTARQLPELLTYRAEWTEDASCTGGGTVQIRTPGGMLMDWLDEQLFAELEQIAGERLTWMEYGAEDPITGVDDAPLLLVTEQSLRELGLLWKQEEELWRRFRPNIIICLDEGEAFEELLWIGRTFQLRDAVLEIVKGCERCSMITIDPRTLRKDPSLLSMIHEGWNGCFGVYARVIRKGNVRRGDGFVHMRSGNPS
jgi:uncharacterized protein